MTFYCQPQAILNVKLAQFSYHCRSQPEASSLWSMALIGWLVSTTIVWAWKYGRNFFAVILRANVILSKSVYLVSASVNTLLTKYIDHGFSPSPNLTKAVLTAVAEAARYR